MRIRIWNQLANIRFKGLYTHRCSRRADTFGRAYSFFLAFVSTSSVAAWAIWTKAPGVWAAIVTVAQVLHIGKPYLPFMKHDKQFLEMSFEFEALYLQSRRMNHAGGFEASAILAFGACYGTDLKCKNVQCLTA